MSLADRKKARAQRKKSARQRVENQQSSTSYEDKRLWSCARDKAGLGSAVIRFLEPTDADIEYYAKRDDIDPDSVPFYTQYYNQAFKGKTGKWFINLCPSTLDNPSPVLDANEELLEQHGGWDALDDEHPVKKTVRRRKRKQVFIANVLIIDDPVNPENNGEVRIFRFGKAIFDQITAQLVPEFEDEESVDVSSYWDGRNFKLKITRKDGFANYDKSSWGDVEPIGTDDEIDSIMAKQYDLHEFITPDKFKSYEDLKKQFEKVEGINTGSRTSVEDDDSGDDSGDNREDRPTAKRRSRRKDSEPEEKSVPQSKPDTGEQNDDDAYFASLLDD